MKQQLMVLAVISDIAKVAEMAVVAEVPALAMVVMAEVPAVAMFVVAEVVVTELVHMPTSRSKAQMCILFLNMTAQLSSHCELTCRL